MKQEKKGKDGANGPGSSGSPSAPTAAAPKASEPATGGPASAPEEKKDQVTQTEPSSGTVPRGTPASPEPTPEQTTVTPSGNTHDPGSKAPDTQNGNDLPKADSNGEGNDDPPPPNPPKPKPNPNPDQVASERSSPGGHLAHGVSGGAGKGGGAGGSASSGPGSTGHQNPGSSGTGTSGGTQHTQKDGLSLNDPGPNVLGKVGGAFAAGIPPYTTHPKTPDDKINLSPTPDVPDLTADVLTATTPVLFFLSAVIVALLGYSLWKVNELGSSWNHVTGQEDTVGVRMSRVLTVELDMQAPPPNNTLLLTPGKGQPTKDASDQKPGKSGKPKSKVGEEGSLPPSTQNNVQSEKKENKPQGTEVNNGTDNQTPEQNKDPVSPSASPVKTSATDGKSGKPDSKVGTEAILVASKNKAQIKETSEQARGLCSTLARTISRNKWWIPATVAVLFIYMWALHYRRLFPASNSAATWGAPAFLGAVAGSIAFMLLIMLIRFYYRRGKAKVPKKALKDKISSQGEKKPEAPNKPEVPDKQDAPKKVEESEKPKAL
ncbi:hypothetical protein AK88_01939 [Plasmodium fragile]|uniref:Uncharacterized protein n=1 Tax=Plasmodium fragile TaxID=5857 RepID=A0A0D9QN20_PLAFR|nr:uncharacterized protein AK88_01939 [Plasmodium fragile]KJP88323.1 hypothetical protein AK88_01939 [Plasmodium fragile]